MPAELWHSRAGLTLSEYLRLDPDGHVREASATLLHSASRAWSSAIPGGIPWAARHVARADALEVVARVDPDTHPRWRRTWRWMNRAYTDAVPAPVTVTEVTLAPWQTDLLGLLSPAIATASRDARQAAAALAPVGRVATERWLEHPPTDCLRYLTGAFVLDMNAAARRRDADAEADAFRTHLARLQDPAEFLGFLGRFPLLARIVTALLSDWAAVAVEFGRRWADDAEDLGRWLDTPARTPDRVQAGLGDRHRGGRTAARVEIDGQLLAYKPTSLDVATLLHDAHSAVTGRPFPAPEVLAREGYGWMRWALPAAADGPAAAQAHFRRLGELNALAWTLGATDLHAENLVAGADGPVLVDLETMLSPGQRHAHAGHNHPVPGILLESPVNTGILPMSLSLAPGEEMDASVFGGGGPRPMVSGWADGGTGRMRAIEVEVPEEELPGVLKDRSGAVIDPLGAVDAVIDGSREAFAAIAAAADSWRRELQRLPAPAPRVRVLLRDTALYGRIARYLQHPAVLHNPLLGESAFELLDPAAVHDLPEYQAAVIEAERRALADGEVPYFEVALDSTDLILDDGQCLAGFFETSALQRALAHLDRAGTDADALIWVTSSALRAAQANRDRSREFTICCAQPPGQARDGDLAAGALAIADRLCALANRDGSGLSWLTLRVDDSDNWRPVAADRSIYLGTLGIQLFFEALEACAMSTARHREVLDRLRGQRTQSLHGLPPGVFDGSAGELFAEIMLARLGAPAGPRDPAELLSLLDADAELPDLLTGQAGLVLLAGAAARQWPALTDQAEVNARRHAAELIAAARRQPVGCAWPVDGELNAGLAHGSAGIGVALADLARWTSDPRLRLDLQDCLIGADAWEDEVYDAGEGNWPDLRASNTVGGFSFSWCNGSAGIGLARAMRLHLGGDPDGRLRRDLERALATTGASGLGHGQGLCHGDAGVSELFLVAGRLAERDDWSAQARLIAAMVAQQLQRDNGVARLDFAADVDVPGLVHGSAGVGYHLLRVLHPDRVPSILTLGMCS